MTHPNSNLPNLNAKIEEFITELEIQEQENIPEI